MLGSSRTSNPGGNRLNTDLPSKHRSSKSPERKSSDQLPLLSLGSSISDEESPKAEHLSHLSLRSVHSPADFQTASPVYRFTSGGSSHNTPKIGGQNTRGTSLLQYVDSLPPAADSLQETQSKSAAKVNLQSMQTSNEKRLKELEREYQQLGKALEKDKTQFRQSTDAMDKKPSETAGKAGEELSSSVPPLLTPRPPERARDGSRGGEGGGRGRGEQDAGAERQQSQQEAEEDQEESGVLRSSGVVVVVKEEDTAGGDGVQQQQQQQQQGGGEMRAPKRRRGGEGSKGSLPMSKAKEDSIFNINNEDQTSRRSSSNPASPPGTAPAQRHVSENHSDLSPPGTILPEQEEPWRNAEEVEEEDKDEVEVVRLSEDASRVVGGGGGGGGMGGTVRSCLSDTSPAMETDSSANFFRSRSQTNEQEDSTQVEVFQLDEDHSEPQDRITSKSTEEILRNVEGIGGPTTLPPKVKLHSRVLEGTVPSEKRGMAEVMRDAGFCALLEEEVDSEISTLRTEYGEMIEGLYMNFKKEAIRCMHQMESRYKASVRVALENTVRRHDSGDAADPDRKSEPPKKEKNVGWNAMAPARSAWDTMVPAAWDAPITAAWDAPVTAAAWDAPVTRQSGWNKPVMMMPRHVNALTGKPESEKSTEMPMMGRSHLSINSMVNAMKGPRPKQAKKKAGVQSVASMLQLHKAAKRTTKLPQKDDPDDKKNKKRLSYLDMVSSLSTAPAEDSVAENSASASGTPSANEQQLRNASSRFENHRMDANTKRGMRQNKLRSSNSQKALIANQDSPNVSRTGSNLSGVTPKLRFNSIVKRILATNSITNKLALDPETPMSDAGTTSDFLLSKLEEVDIWLHGLVLEEENPMRWIWDAIYFTFMVCSSFRITYNASFVWPGDYTTPLLYWGDIVYFVLSDIVFNLDVVINFFTTYRDSEGMVVWDLRQIAHNYASTWLAVDLFSSIPWDRIGAWIFSGASWCKFLRLIRLVNLLKFNHRLENLEKTVQNPLFLRLFNAAFHIGATVHFFSCITHWVAYETTHPDEWIGSVDFLEKDNPVKYARLVFFVSTSILGNSSYPSDMVSVLTSLLVFWCGLVMYFTVISSLVTVLVNMNLPKSEYNRNRDQRITFMNQLNVPSRLRMKILHYFEELNEVTKKVDAKAFMQGLPHHLRQEMSVFLYEGSLQTFDIFQNCELPFVTAVMMRLTIAVCLEGDLLCLEGDLGDEMYFVINGDLNVYKEGVGLVASLKEGDFFGEGMMLVENARRNASVKAMKSCTLYSLTRPMFKEIYSAYPEDSRVFFEAKAEKRAKELETAERNAEAK